MEKRPSTPVRLVLGIVIVSLAVAGVLLLVRTSTPQSTEKRQAATSTTKVHDSKTAAPILVQRDDMPPALDRPAATQAEMIAQILRKDEKLRLFMSYYNDVLLNKQRRDEYHKLLSDHEMMTAMAEALMKPGSGPVHPEEQYHRLLQNDYFEAALNWKENPQRQEVLDLTGQVITKDNFISDQDHDRRQMLAGGKMELYRLMYGQDAAKAQEMVAQAKGTRMESLVTWMAEEDQKRRVREEEIRKEAQEQQAKAN